MTSCIGGIQFSVGECSHVTVPVKQMSILKNDTQGTAEVCLTDLVDVDAVVADLTILNIVETVDQVGNGGFTGSGGTDKGNLFAGICKKL